MGQLEDLKPSKKPRVFDLVQEVGLNVSDWANFSRGPKWAAANPKYCYEWAFVEPGRVVIVNLWFTSLHEARGTVTWSGNLRDLIGRHSGPGAKAVWRKRAEHFENAIQEAAAGTLPIRVIVNDGKMRNTADLNAKASTVQRRLLDPLPWAVTSYDTNSGQCTLTRGVITKGSVDQFDLSKDGDEVVERVSVQSTVFVRDPSLRAAALRRANGRCEFCLRRGFKIADGRVFLETHHVIPLSEGGTDSPDNVAAVCPNHHREAHHGSRAKVIRETLLNRLRRALGMKAV
jgi:5-methylcytosine-specific restriction protein A